MTKRIFAWNGPVFLPMILLLVCLTFIKLTGLDQERNVSIEELEKMADQHEDLVGHGGPDSIMYAKGYREYIILSFTRHSLILCYYGGNQPPHFGGNPNIRVYENIRQAPNGSFIAEKVGSGGDVVELGWSRNGHGWSRFFYLIWTLLSTVFFPLWLVTIIYAVYFVRKKYTEDSFILKSFYLLAYTGGGLTFICTIQANYVDIRTWVFFTIVVCYFIMLASSWRYLSGNCCHLLNKEFMCLKYDGSKENWIFTGDTVVISNGKDCRELSISELKFGRSLLLKDEGDTMLLYLLEKFKIKSESLLLKQIVPFTIHEEKEKQYLVWLYENEEDTINEKLIKGLDYNTVKTLDAAREIDVVSRLAPYNKRMKLLNKIEKFISGGGVFSYIWIFVAFILLFVLLFGFKRDLMGHFWGALMFMPIFFFMMLDIIEQEAVSNPIKRKLFERIYQNGKRIAKNKSHNSHLDMTPNN